MIKLTDLVSKDSRFIVKEQKVPDHFDGGENIDIFGYKTKHFDICRSAVDLYEKLKEVDEIVELIGGAEGAAAAAWAAATGGAQPGVQQGVLPGEADAAARRNSELATAQLL